MFLKRHLCASFAVLAVFSMTACGPILSTKGISDAKDAFAKAEEVNAKEKAPYEYTLAQEYLRKADELWGYSKFGDSYKYTELSIEMSEAAVEKVKTAPWVSPLVGAETH